MPRLVVAGALAALVVWASGCYSNPDATGGSDAGSNDAGADAPSCQPYVVPAGTDLMTPTTSFKNDVEPVFINSCAFSGCHNENSNPNVFLGSKMDSTKNAAVRGNLVGKPPIDLPSMPFVTAGDPSKSFLMHKMDGDQCLFDSQCVAPTADAGCQTSMPQNLPLLDVGPRDVVRRWIAQGALDN